MTNTRRLIPIAAAIALTAAWHPAAAQSAPGRVIRGIVYDSLDARPLAGAHVMLLERSDSTAPTRSVIADSLGRFAFSGLPGGVYLLGFDHPLIDSLEVKVASRQILLAATGTEPLVVTLAIPGPRTVHDAFCERASKADSTSVLIGRLVNASTLEAVANGTVTAQWLAVARNGKHVSTVWPTATAQSRADGSYVLCGLPAATQIALQARSDSNTSAVVDITTPAKTGVFRRGFYLTDLAATRGGVVTGVVRSAESKAPIARAQVRVAGDTAIATTGADGSFSLRGVPYGTLEIDARSIGYVPQDHDVDVLADAPGRVAFSMASAKNMLDTVRTYAYADAVNDANGFNQRRKAGWGRYFDSDYIRQTHPYDVNDIIRGSPGVQVTGLGFHAVPLMLSLFPPPLHCVPSFYLDGRPLDDVTESQDLEMYVQPEQISGVEVYRDPIDAPPQYRPMMPTCGTILIWTFPPGHRKPGE